MTMIIMVIPVVMLKMMVIMTTKYNKENDDISDDHHCDSDNYKINDNNIIYTNQFLVIDSHFKLLQDG